MRKLLLLLTALSLAATTLHAQRIRVVEGALTPLADETAVGISFTYEDMQVGKLREADYVARKVSDYNEKEPGRGDIWHENWVNDRAARFEPKFLELYDKYMADGNRNGGLAILTDDEPTRYTLVVNTYFTEPGFNAGIVRQNAAVTLDITLVERETGNVAARVIVENASANSFSGLDFDTGFRIQECYAKAGREFAKFLIKTLKL